MEEGKNGVMRILSRRLVLVCVVAMPLCSLLLSCNSDDDAAEENVIGPDSSAGVSLDDDVLEEMYAAVEQAIGLLVVGGGTVDGAGGGQIVVAGSTFRFAEYSPDGLFLLDGELTMNLLASPITVQGEMTFRDPQRQGPIVVDMTIDIGTDPITYGGTVTVAGEVIDVAATEVGE